jgi:pyruvate dehydrogenase E1 component alpha subunit
MHVSDMDLGILGANGIVGAGIPIALGSALAHSMRDDGGVAVAFFGDGAMAEGVLHETLNIASLWAPAPSSLSAKTTAGRSSRDSSTHSPPS